MDETKIVFDTNALLDEPSLIERFADRIVIPCVVFDEINRLKKDKEV